MTGEEALSVVSRRAALIRHAEELEARIAAGERDPDVIIDALAARAAALGLESK